MRLAWKVRAAVFQLTAVLVIVCGKSLSPFPEPPNSASPGKKKIVKATFYINTTSGKSVISESENDWKDFYSEKYAVACRSAYMSAHEEGNWNRIWIETSDQVRASEAAYAAGYLEGKYTATNIELMFQNNYADWFTDYKGGPQREPVYRFLKQNLDYMEEMVKSSPDSLVWKRVGLILDQIRGLVDGYNSQDNVHPLSIEDFLLLNADGDIESLSEFLPRRSNTTERDKELRCSALVKLLHNNKDVYFGHSTWDHLDMMGPRMLKSYDFTKLEGIKGYKVVMSSSPGFVSSVDDFYVNSNGLVIIETTNGNYNKNLWKLVKPESLLSWVRSSLANSASTGSEWVELFSMQNSGTYNNQWFVFDTKKFTKGKPLENGTFWVLEQLPGKIVARDQSVELQSETYWASYNVPYYEEVWKLSKFSELLPRWKFSHKECPRAKIFRERQKGIRNLTDFMYVMRYNDYKNDPLSRGDACYAISSRCDLNKVDSLIYRLSGGIDAKVTSIGMAKNANFLAQIGPTHDETPYFSWKRIKPSKKFPKIPSHVGQSEEYKFGWEVFGTASSSESFKVIGAKENMDILATA